MYFISFIIGGSFIIVNLFVGVVLNFVSEMESVEYAETQPVMRELGEIKAQLADLQTQLRQATNQGNESVR